jgi:predicted nucleic acid-binding Zn ribbon protein
MPRKLLYRWCGMCGKPLGESRELYCHRCRVIMRREYNHNHFIAGEFGGAW